MTTTIHYKQLAPAWGLCVVRIQTTCQPLNIPVMVPVGMNSSTGGLIGGSRSGLPSDSGRVWVCCSTDGPVIRWRDRQAHSFYSLAAPLWDRWLTGLLFLLKALCGHTDCDEGEDYKYNCWAKGQRPGPAGTSMLCQTSRGFSHCLAKILNSTQHQAICSAKNRQCVKNSPYLQSQLGFLAIYWSGYQRVIFG